MPKQITIILFLSLLSITTLYPVELDWGHNYDAALESAKSQKKLVYLFIGADRCRFCSRFKKMTLSKTEVIDRMKKDFILLYLSRDRQKIPKGFECYGVPRHYFLTPEGKIIRTEQGIWDPEGWYTILDEVLSERDEAE